MGFSAKYNSITGERERERKESIALIICIYREVPSFSSASISILISTYLPKVSIYSEVQKV
jgi:hypothetical protein